MARSTISTSFLGGAEMTKRLDQLRRGFPTAARRALRGLANDKLELAQERVPFKTGQLHDTGRISVRAGTKQFRAAIRFGGPKAPYAVIVHEDLETEFRKGRRAKYLESVALEARVTAGAELARRIDVERLG